MQIPRLSKEYEMKFEINVKSFPNNLASILHMTTGSNCCDNGNRIPAIWGKEGSTPYIHVCTAISGNGNTCKDINIGTNKWIKIKLFQTRQLDGRYLFQCDMDGVIVWSTINNQAKEFENIKMFASNPWHTPFVNGVLRNLEICPRGRLTNMCRF